jgi:hypothetical protein
MAQRHDAGHARNAFGDCWDWGKVGFAYGDAYVALAQLRKRGLAGRRCLKDQWGDDLATHVYFAVAPTADPTDPLEQVFALSSSTVREHKVRL